MYGVTILNTYVEEMAVMQPWCGIGLSLSIGGIVGLAIFAIISGSYSDCHWLRNGIIIWVICAVIGILIGIFAPRETEDRYQVIIDDSVSFNEFYENYEVLEINGQIYTVRVLTNEE